MIHQNTIIASLASIPSRIGMLEQCIESILSQVDVLNVYLNDYLEVPTFLKRKKIKIFNSHEFGDLADVGKFFPLKNYQGYLFTLDDDLVYPNDYVEIMLKKIKQYNHQVFVCVHGNILPKRKLTSYYREKKGVHYAKELLFDTVVDVPGTGTLAYHSNLYQVNLAHFARPYMTDIFLYKIASQNKIPIISIERCRHWVKPIKSFQDYDSIYNRFCKNDKLQTDIINDVISGVQNG